MSDPQGLCVLCAEPGGLQVWADAHWRVVRVDDADHPAFYRVIAQAHVAEFSQLALAQRQRCMALVNAIEEVLLAQLHATKVNLASLGNVVAHVHWHVIARFDWDCRFPQPIWGAVQRGVEPAAVQRLAISLAELDQHVVDALQGV